MVAALPNGYSPAMPRALKVYRMPVGFHDAYVAAPSQKAAIEAWGADKDVFRRGTAEEIEDPKLTEEPLANPGKVVKRLRGTAAEQIAALDETEEPVPKRSSAEARKDGKAKAKPAPKPKPRPSRARLEEAEAALAEAEARREEQVAAIRKREAALAAERKALEKKQDRERERLEARREKAAAAYEAAMEKWRG